MCSTRIWDESQFVSLTVSFQAKEEEGEGEEKLGDTGSIMDEALRQQMKEQERKDLRGGRPVDEETL